MDESQQHPTVPRTSSVQTRVSSCKWSQRGWGHENTPMSNPVNLLPIPFTSLSQKPISLLCLKLCPSYWESLYLFLNIDFPGPRLITAKSEWNSFFWEFHYVPGSWLCPASDGLWVHMKSTFFLQIKAVLQHVQRKTTKISPYLGYENHGWFSLPEHISVGKFKLLRKKCV